MRQNMVLMPRFVSLNTFNIFCRISSKLRDKVPHSDTALFESAPPSIKLHELVPHPQRKSLTSANLK